MPREFRDLGKKEGASLSDLRARKIIFADLKGEKLG
jgi:hypothetical protein